MVFGGGFLVVRSVYFLGTDNQGEVALYRGLPYSLPLGISLYSKRCFVRGNPLRGAQRAVTGHTLRGKGDATDLINDIKSRPTEGLPPPPLRPAKKKSGGNKGQQAKKVELPHPRAIRPDPGRAPGHGWVHGRADHQLGQARQPESVLRGLLSWLLYIASASSSGIQLPDADPFLLPAASALLGFGSGDALSAQHGPRFVLGLVLFSPQRCPFLRDYEALEHYG